jgi:hypothetical protein
LKYLLSNVPGFFIYLFITLSLVGCYATEAVKIKVRVDSKVDMSDYNTIAVMDFVNMRSGVITDDGEILARMVRKNLNKSKEFEVLDEKNIYLRLDDEIDKSKIEDPEALISISDQLAVDALIVGTYDFYQRNQPVPYYAERYSPNTGRYRYNPETRTYMRRVNHLLLHLKLVDGDTGETVFDYKPPTNERPVYRSTWGLPMDRNMPNQSSLKTLGTKLMKDFIINLVPHYEYEQRKLVR